MSHDTSPGEPDELVALYLVGALSPEEHRAAEAHLTSGCAACREEFRQLADVVDVLAAGIVPVAPDPLTRRRLLERIAADSPTPSTGSESRRDQPSHAPAPTTRRAARARWSPTGLDGVAIRMLSIDRHRDRLTALIRMVPGSRIPAHVHEGPEELLLIEGDLREGGRVFTAGDYQNAPPGSRHDEATSDAGCLALVIMSIDVATDSLLVGSGAID